MVKAHAKAGLDSGARIDKERKRDGHVAFDFGVLRQHLEYAPRRYCTSHTEEVVPERYASHLIRLMSFPLDTDR
jgi:hypothetical protein